jgi:hypothetical protein
VGHGRSAYTAEGLGDGSFSDLYAAGGERLTQQGLTACGQKIETMEEPAVDTTSQAYRSA